MYVALKFCELLLPVLLLCATTLTDLPENDYTNLHSNVTYVDIYLEKSVTVDQNEWREECYVTYKQGKEYGANWRD